MSTAAGLLALTVALTAASPAMAGKPTGEYEVFNDCPLKTLGVTECVYSQTTGGELVVGKMSIPIKKTIIFQGGQVVTEKEEVFVEPTEGTTLSKTAEEVPGGFESKPLTATLELVGSVTLSRKNLAASEGVALKLPTRLHLKNEFLGESCFVGSSAKPITLNLTTGATSPPPPNKSIKGTAGTFESKEGGNLLVYKGDSLVDNAFADSAGAAGCGGINESIIDPILNTKFGFPSAAGHNSAVMSGTSKFASAQAVRESE